MKDYNPQMHTAEHILNQTMVRMFNKGRNFSAHLEKKKSKCDYRNFDRNLTEAEISELENSINDVINQNLDITEEFWDYERASKYFDLSKLPNNSGTNIRIVSVGNYDSCPCIGKHVSNTSEIGKVKIISTSFENTVLRIRFKLV